jgi:hypothetical protein
VDPVVDVLDVEIELLQQRGDSLGLVDLSQRFGVPHIAHLSSLIEFLTSAHRCLMGEAQAGPHE